MGTLSNVPVTTNLKALYEHLGITSADVSFSHPTDLDHYDINIPSVVQVFLDALYVSIDPEVSGLHFSKTNALIETDRKAGKVREKFITVGSGMELTYTQKYNEALAYKLASYTDLPSYPFVEAESQASGLSGQDAADDIIANGDAWKIIGSQIEKQRRLGKLNIAQQTTLSDVKTALDAVITALDSIT